MPMQLERVVVVISVVTDLDVTVKRLLRTDWRNRPQPHDLEVTESSRPMHFVKCEETEAIDPSRYFEIQNTC